MSQRSRQQLATDAEKLYAADQLWERHNALLAYVVVLLFERALLPALLLHRLHSAGQPHSVLTEAVYTYMHAAGEGHHEDFMRAFFRLEVQDLGSLLPHVLDVLRRSAREVTHTLSEVIPQANDVLLVRAFVSFLQNVVSSRLTTE